MALSGTGTQKIQNLGLYVLDIQGSKIHEGEWPNKSGRQYQAWHSTLIPFKKARRCTGSIKIYMLLGIIMEPLALLIILYRVFCAQSIHWTSEKKLLRGENLLQGEH